MASIGSKTGVEKAHGGITRRSIKDGEIVGRKLHPDVASLAYGYYAGKGTPLLVLGDMSGFAAGTVDVECLARLPGGLDLWYAPFGTGIASAPFGPSVEDDGLSIAPEATENDGLNIQIGGRGFSGGFNLGNPFSLSLGGNPASWIMGGRFLRAKLKISDVSGTDGVAVGFRKMESYKGTVAGYAEVACLNMVSGNIRIQTVYDGGAMVNTDTTLDWLDNEIHEFLVTLDDNAKAHFFVDGREPTVSRVFTAHTGVIYVPFLYTLQDASHSAVHVRELEVGTFEQLRSYSQYSRLLS